MSELLMNSMWSVCMSKCILIPVNQVTVILYVERLLISYDISSVKLLNYKVHIKWIMAPNVVWSLILSSHKLVYIYNFIRSSVYMPYTHIWKTLDWAFPRYKISIYSSDLIIPKSATGNMQYWPQISGVHPNTLFGCHYL